MEPLYAERASIAKFVESFYDMVGEGSSSGLIRALFGAISSNSLFYPIAAGCRCVGLCTGIKK